MSPWRQTNNKVKIELVNKLTKDCWLSQFYASGRADDTEAKQVMMLMIMMPRVMITMMQLLMGQWMTCDKLSSGARLPLYSEQYYTWWFTNSMICCHIVSQTIQYTVAIISCHIVTQWLLFSLKRESFDAQAMHNAQLHIGLLHNAHCTLVEVLCWEVNVL